MHQPVHQIQAAEPDGTESNYERGGKLAEKACCCHIRNFSLLFDFPLTSQLPPLLPTSHLEAPRAFIFFITFLFLFVYVFIF